MRTFNTAFAATALLAGRVSAHSWIWCTDYIVADPDAELMGPDETDAARRVFDADLCEGYPPSFPTFIDPFADGVFGVDTGYNQEPAFTRGDTSSQLCTTRANTYTDALPMAEYTSGETVCLAYPAKNHVASSATNIFIPDNGVAVYMAPLGSAITDSNFPSTADFLTTSDTSGLLVDLNGVHVDGVEDFLGFQNCPDFGGAIGTDRVTCTMCFELPEGLATGEYYFAWHWEFNPGSHYSTCWSAQVTANGDVVETEEQETEETEAATTTTTEATTTTVTTTTEVQETIDGAECSAIAFALCDRGLGRGTCAVTDEDAQAEDNTTGFVCDCEDGFFNADNSMICNIEGGVELEILYNVPTADVTDFELLALSLAIEIAGLLDIDVSRLTVEVGANEDDLVLALLTITGQSSSTDIAALSFADQLMSLVGTDDMHDAGFMGNTLSVTCLNCDDVETELEEAAAASAASAVAPSLAMLAAAAAASALF